MTLACLFMAMLWLLPSGLGAINTPLFTLLAILPLETSAISCYICSSYGGLWGCLDPFDYQPIVRKNCDFEPWVRGPPYPVFCEKRTDIVDGQYITTRGCSQETWEDIKGYQSVRDGHIPCIRRGRKETCLCSEDSCNSAPSSTNFSWAMSLLLATWLFRRVL